MKRLLAVAGVVWAVACAQAAVYEFDLWSGSLSGAQQVPPNTSSAGGGEFDAGIWYDDVLKALTINIEYGIAPWEPLEGDYTGSHIRFGDIGETGFVVLDLDSIVAATTTKSGILQGILTLPIAYEEALLGNLLYVNVNSTKHPFGEIRGQLILIPEPGILALLGVGLGSLFFFRRTRS